MDGRLLLIPALVAGLALPTGRCFRSVEPPPPTGCAVPANAVPLAPGASLQSAVNAHPQGTSFLLKAGTHRLQRVSPKSGNSFYGERDADCARLSVMSGARLLTQFEALDGLYVARSQTQQGERHGYCEPGYPRCDRPEDLFFDGVPLRHVASRAEVVPGTWYFDYEADSVWFADPPEGHVVEISVSRSAFLPSASLVAVRGLVVEKYATPAQAGAIGDRQAGMIWTIEDNEVRFNHGTGIHVQTGSKVRGNKVHHNGQLGIGAAGVDVLIQGNEIFGNNTAGFAAVWEAGGAKFSFTRRLHVRDNCVHNNRGSGLWTDIDNVDTRYEGNVVFANRDQGIFHEISHAAVIRDNWVGGNGENSHWLYGANILISTSDDVEVYGNRVEVAATHGHAIAVIWQDRSVDGDYESTGNVVRDNEISFLGASGLAGVAADFDPAWTLAFTNNAFDGNLYHLAVRSHPYFEWDNQAGSFTWFRAQGQELHGRSDGSVVPLDWRCDMRSSP